MFEQIQSALAGYNGTWKDKKGVNEFTSVIAERKAFLSTKKLTYSARIKIDDTAKIVNFSEMLIEAGSGLSSGGDFDGGISPGFGFKTETFNTLKGGREGNIAEQSNLFSQKFEYKFDYKEIRSKIESAAEAAGYKLQYQILPVK